jgi:hypothetical protein
MKKITIPVQALIQNDRSYINTPVLKGILSIITSQYVGKLGHYPIF